jgi:hypothetical protein
MQEHPRHLLVDTLAEKFPTRPCMRAIAPASFEVHRSEIADPDQITVGETMLHKLG